MPVPEAGIKWHLGPCLRRPGHHAGRLAFRSAVIHAAPAFQYALSRGSPSPTASISQASHHRSAVSSGIPEPVRVLRMASRRAWKMRSGVERRAMARG